MSYHPQANIWRFYIYVELHPNAGADGFEVSRGRIGVLRTGGGGGVAAMGFGAREGWRVDAVPGGAPFCPVHSGGERVKTEEQARAEGVPGWALRYDAAEYPHY